MENEVVIKAVIEVLQGAEIELAECDGYDLGRPLGVRVAINSLLAGLGVEPKDLEGEAGTVVDAGLVAYGRSLACAPSPLTEEQAKERAREVVQAWHEAGEARCAQCTSPFSHEGLYSRIASELMAVATVPSVPEGADRFSIAAHNERAIELSAQRWLEDAGRRRSATTSRDEIDAYDTVNDLLKMVRRQGVALLRATAPSTPSSSSLARRIAEKIAKSGAFRFDVINQEAYREADLKMVANIVELELAATSTEPGNDPTAVANWNYDQD